MISLDNFSYLADQELYPVIIDGRHAGYAEEQLAKNLVDAIRKYKIEGDKLPKETEIAFMKKGKFKNTIYPMIYITTAPARFLRPVKFLPLDSV